MSLGGEVAYAALYGNKVGRTRRGQSRGGVDTTYYDVMGKTELLA
jgi:hypothetical protein